MPGSASSAARFPSPDHRLYQAPFTTTRRELFHEAFRSVRRVYQTFAGSLRLIELVQREFERRRGLQRPVRVSWGGVTVCSTPGRWRRGAPSRRCLSPNLAQVLDGAELVGQAMPISKAELDNLLDFTPRCAYDPARVFPLLGETDVFFKLEKHAGQFDSEPVVVPRAHVFSLYGVRPLREHILRVMGWAEQNPL
jgi:hypothetical protein